jgi:hypothetical protein
MLEHKQIDEHNTAYKLKQWQIHIILSLDAEQAFDKIQYSFITKPLIT